MYDDEEKDSTTAFRMDCKMSSINRRRCQDEKCERRGGGSTPSSEQDDVDGKVDRDDGLTESASLKVMRSPNREIAGPTRVGGGDK